MQSLHAFSLTPYRAIVSAYFRTGLQYRAAALAGILTQAIFGLIHIMVFEAFYQSSDLPQPMAYPQVVTYIWLGQAMLGMLPWSIHTDIRTMIRTGTVAYELARPLDLYVLWYSRGLAALTAPTLLRAVPLCVIAGLFFGLRLPPSPASSLAWALTTFGALLLACAISTLLNISLFWTLSGDGLSRLAPTAVMVFSGMLIPLPFFPDWLQPVLNALPFRGLVDVPFRLYTGHMPPGDALGLFGFQIAWTVVLIAVGYGVLNRGIRRLVVQGG